MEKPLGIGFIGWMGRFILRIGGRQYYIQLASTVVADDGVLLEDNPSALGPVDLAYGLWLRGPKLDIGKGPETLEELFMAPGSIAGRTSLCTRGGIGGVSGGAFKGTGDETDAGGGMASAYVGSSC